MTVVQAAVLGGWESLRLFDFRVLIFVFTLLSILIGSIFIIVGEPISIISQMVSNIPEKLLWEMKLREIMMY